MIKVRIVLLAGLLVLVAMAGCRSAHTTAAILYIDEQNYHKAVDVIHEGFQYRDDEPDAYYYLGEAYSHLAEEYVEEDAYLLAKQNYSLAYEAYSKVLEISPEEWNERIQESLLYNYTQRLLQAKRDWEENYFEQAEGNMRLAYAALPDSVTPIEDIAQLKMQMSDMGDFEDQREELLNEALVLIDQVLAERPEAYFLQANKAGVLVKLDRNDEAKALYEQLLVDHGDDTNLLLDAAAMAIKDGDLERTADFYVRVVDLNEADAVDNDDQNKELLVDAGRFYMIPDYGRYEDSIAVLDRAANLELIPMEETMLTRVKSYFAYGTYLEDQAELETDEIMKADLLRQSREIFSRCVEIARAMTNNFVGNAQGFQYLGLAQFKVGDDAAGTAAIKTYQELMGMSNP